MGMELKNRSLLKLNYKFFIDHCFLRDGAYINVPSGQLFYDGSDMSVLLPDTNAHNYLYGVSVGQVWQSPFRQWIYESGVQRDGTNIQSAPILASGVYIEGAFRHTSDSIFGHKIDYLNGRIIFNNPQSLDLKVHGDFSVREVRTAFEHDFNQQFLQGYLESKYTTNPLTSNQIIYPSGVAQPFPAVFIEVDGRTHESYELGNRSLVLTDDIIFYVWALDDVQRDNIVDILYAQARKVIPIIDFNKVPLPLSGIYNCLSPEYINYQTLLSNNTIVCSFGSGTPIRYLSYIDEVILKNLQAAEEFERSQVIFKVKTYLNAPTTPLGNGFGPITSIGNIEGFI